MNSESVDLIYLDPPFNSKRTYAAPVGSKAAGTSFKDMWTWADVDEDLLENIVVEYPFLVQFIQSVGAMHSPAMKAYITYMTQRIIQLHRVLKSTGSFYIHIDPTASHYLKIVLDRIFGKDNFRNEIIWRRTSPKKGTRKLASVHDVILFYAASTENKFNTVYEEYDPEYIKKFYRHSDEHGVFRTVTLTAPGVTKSGASGKPWREIDPTIKGRHWALPGTFPEHIEIPKDWNKTTTNDGLDYLDSVGLIYWPKKVNGIPQFKRYLSTGKGVAMTDLILDTPALSSHSNERTGYPTQKPLALLERIIKASSNEGDVVLDPFAGCATTCVAAQQLGRKWIGIDIEEKAADLVIHRLSDNAGLFKDFVHRTDIPQRTDVKTEKPTLSIKTRLHKDQSGICNGCQKKYEEKIFEIDHIIPKSKGGGDYYDNYQLLCGNCNKIKGNKPMEHLTNRIRQINETKNRLSF